MHPVLFEIFGIPISPYGLLIATGLIVGVALARRRARRVGIPEDAVLDVVFWGAIAGFLGARVAYIFVNFKDFLSDPGALLLSRQGFVFMGGLIGAIPVVMFVLRRWHVRFMPMADLLAPLLALVHAFGRGGCFFAGCCFGAVTTSPLGVEFPRTIEWVGGPADPSQMIIDSGAVWLPGGQAPVGYITGSPAFFDHAAKGLCLWTDTHSLAVHPTQLYDVGIQLALFALLTWLWLRRRFHGQVFLVYLWLYPITRILLETVRGDPRGTWPRDPWIINLSTSQILSIALLIGALVLTIKRSALFAPADAPVMTESSSETTDGAVAQTR
jgi:phosphatidylglycerol:prolipoprotein diacylglycerol transferase